MANRPSFVIPMRGTNIAASVRMKNIVGIVVGMSLAAGNPAAAAEAKREQPEQIFVTLTLEDPGEAPREIYIIAGLGKEAEWTATGVGEAVKEKIPDNLSLKFSSKRLSKHLFRFSVVATIEGQALPKQTLTVDVEKGARITLRAGDRPLSVEVDYVTMELLRRKGKKHGDGPR